LLAGQFAFAVSQGVFAIYAGRLMDRGVEANGLAPAWWNSGMGFTALAMTVTGLASVLTSFAWGRLHDGGMRFLTPVGAGLLAASMATLLLTPPWWVVLLARMGFGAGIAAMTLQFAVISAAAAPDQRNQQLNLATALTHAGNLAGFVMGGVLASWWEEIGNFALAGAVYCVILVATCYRERRAVRWVDDRSTNSNEPCVVEPAFP
jgi:predicted MFS family arabinose efflux permease